MSSAGFGVTWLAAVPYANNEKTNQQCNINDLTSSTSSCGSAFSWYRTRWDARSNRYSCGSEPQEVVSGLSKPTRLNTSRASICKLENADLLALRRLAPAYVRTDIPLPWFTSCPAPGKKASLTWSNPLFQDKLYMLEQIERLGIRLVIAVPSPPSSESCYAYADPSGESVSCSVAASTPVDGGLWLAAVEALLHHLSDAVQQNPRAGIRYTNLSDLRYFGETSEPDGNDVYSGSRHLITYSDWLCASEKLDSWLRSAKHNTYRIALLGPTPANPDATVTGSSDWGCSTGRSDCWPTLVNSDTTGAGRSLVLGAYDLHNYLGDTREELPRQFRSQDCGPTGSAAQSEGAAELNEVDTDTTQLSQIATDVKKLHANGSHVPVLMTEVGISDYGTSDSACTARIQYGGYGITTERYGVAMFDYGLRLINVGVNGALAWSLDYDVTNSSVPAGGMINDLTASSEPWFHTWQVLGDSFPAGASVHGVSAEPGIDAAAAEHGGDWAVALVDMSSNLSSLQLTPPSGTSGDDYAVCTYNQGSSASVGWKLEAEGTTTGAGLAIPLSRSSAVVVDIYPKSHSPECAGVRP